VTEQDTGKEPPGGLPGRCPQEACTPPASTRLGPVTSVLVSLFEMGVSVSHFVAQAGLQLWAQAMVPPRSPE
jgi:hypothetical protein